MEEENGFHGENGQNGEADTMESEGTVSTIDEQNKMFVLSHLTGEDTIYYDETAFVAENGESILQRDAELRVKYQRIGERNQAVKIESTQENGERQYNGEQNGEYNGEQNGEQDGWPQQDDERKQDGRWPDEGETDEGVPQDGQGWPEY